MNSSVQWIDSNSWEVPFFGLPTHIPWPANVDAAIANQEPFEVEHLLDAIDLLGPDAGEPWIAFGRAARHFEDLAEAMEDAEMVRAGALLEAMEREHPGTSFVRFHRGSVARAEGRSEDAIALYREAAAITPQIREIWDNLGIVLALLGRRDEAIDAFRKALGILPNDRVALEGLAQLRVLVKLMRDANDQNSAMYVDIPQFRQMAASQIQGLSGNHDQLMVYGEQLMRDGLATDVGLQALERALELQPQNPRTLLAVSAGYRVTGNNDKAKATALKVTEMHPNEPIGFFHLAQVCNAAGDNDGERAALTRMLELDPNSQQALGILFEIGPGEHDPAKEDRLVAFGSQRNSWMAFLLASQLTRERGDFGRAVRWAERARQINPESEDVLLHYTTVLGEARELGKLANVIKPQVESGKFSKRLDWNYAQVLRQLGLTQDAIAVLRKAAAGDVPDDFKASVTLTIDAWAGFLTGSGVQLEVHTGGFLKRPVLLALADGDGGVIVNAGIQLPKEGAFPWRATSSEVTISTLR